MKKKITENTVIYDEMTIYDIIESLPPEVNFTLDEYFTLLIDGELHICIPLPKPFNLYAVTHWGDIVQVKADKFSRSKSGSFVTPWVYPDGLYVSLFHSGVPSLSEIFKVSTLVGYTFFGIKNIFSARAVYLNDDNKDNSVWNLSFPAITKETSIWG